MQKSPKGFTLIELLVVIAIIGILSAVVLASLSTARTKGKDAAVQSDLNTVQSQAAIYYNGTTGNGTYGLGVTASVADCTTGLFADPNVANALTGIGTNGSTATCILISDGTNASGYVAAATSQSVPGSYYCVDSSGEATTTTVAPTTSSTACGN